MKKEFTYGHLTAEDFIEMFLNVLFKEFPEVKKRLKDDMKNTPKRFVETIRSMFNGYKIEEGYLKELLKPVYLSTYKGMVVQKNIIAYSLCPHHLLPIKYYFAIGYIPKHGKAVGLSKLAHLCGYYASRPDLQETMTTSIIESLNKYLTPVGCGVVVVGIHNCILLGAGETHAPEIRQVTSTTKDNISNVTAELRGDFLKDPTRKEFYAQIQGWLDMSGGM